MDQIIEKIDMDDSDYSRNIFKSDFVPENRNDKSLSTIQHENQTCDNSFINHMNGINRNEFGSYSDNTDSLAS